MSFLAFFVAAYFESLHAMRAYACLQGISHHASWDLFSSRWRTVSEIFSAHLSHFLPLYVVLSFTQVISRKWKLYLDLLCKFFRVFVAGGANFLDENSNVTCLVCVSTLWKLLSLRHVHFSNLSFILNSKWRKRTENLNLISSWSMKFLRNRRKKIQAQMPKQNPNQIGRATCVVTRSVSATWRSWKALIFATSTS